MLVSQSDEDRMDGGAIERTVPLRERQPAKRARGGPSGNSPRLSELPLVVSLAFCVILAAGRPLEFRARSPTAPDPGSWANPYEATDPVAGERHG